MHSCLYPSVPPESSWVLIGNTIAVHNAVNSEHTENKPSTGGKINTNSLLLCREQLQQRRQTGPLRVTAFKHSWWWWAAAVWWAVHLPPGDPCPTSANEANYGGKTQPHYRVKPAHFLLLSNTVVCTQLLHPHVTWAENFKGLILTGQFMSPVKKRKSFQLLFFSEPHTT